MNSTFDTSICLTPLENIYSVAIISLREPVVDYPFFAYCRSYIIIDYGESTIKTQKRGRVRTPKMYIKPPRSHTFTLTKAAASKFALFSLQPTFFFKATKKSAYTHQYDFIPLADIAPKEICEKFYSTVQGLDQATDAKQFFKSNFRSQLSNWETITTPFDDICTFILAKKGNCSITQIQDIWPFSISTLNRYSKKYVGMTIGQFIRNVKFCSFIQHVNNPNKTLKDIISEFDYYDHSHFNKDFKQFSGLNPIDYKTENFSLFHEVYEYFKSL